jgi:isoaspartyl peptidase/L-asparaginase-like protein (Ntn-hydrolase superfamily)
MLIAERGRGSGGLVLVDRHGAFAFARTTQTMSWAVMTADSEPSFGF